MTIYDGFSRVLVKAAAHHALGTLMPYPSEDPLICRVCLPDMRLFSDLQRPNSLVLKEAGIHSISLVKFPEP
jgi:hypothetical protein